MNQGQKANDLKRAKKLCKDAISEIDFSDVAACTIALIEVRAIVNNY